MARPCCCKRVSGMPPAGVFKPAGVPRAALEEVVLAVEEFEAVRLADLEGLYQEEAAARMGISRPTFGRLVEAARRKVADALVGGKALRIEGGTFVVPGTREFRCEACGRLWPVPHGDVRPAACPACKSEDLHRAFCPGNPGGRRGRRCRTGERRGQSEGRKGNV